MASQTLHSLLTNSLLRVSATTAIMLIILAIFQASVNSKASITWQATVATGNATDAGTNGTIYLIFKGTINISEVHLWSMNGALFQRGQVSVFKITSDDIGQLLELTIIHAEYTSQHIYLNWQLDHFLLLDENRSTEYGFHYMNYIPDYGQGYGNLTLQPDTIRQLDNKTTVSSSMDPLVFSTRYDLVFNASVSYSNNPHTFLTSMDTSGFSSATHTISFISSLHASINGFVSILTSDSIFLSVTATSFDKSESFSSLMESSPTKNVKATSMLFPTSEISFTNDADTLYSTAVLPDITTDSAITRISGEASIHLTPMSTLRTSVIFSSCSCLESEGVSIAGDVSLRMASISKELRIDTKELSTYKRKKSSAPDDRNSAKAIGFVAILFLALPVVYIILIDLSNYKRFFPEKQKRRIGKQNKRTAIKV